MQLEAAKKHGVKPVHNREDAEHRKKELVYVGSNPYFYVDRLNNSIPYLVPRASVLLQDIGRSFFDSLQVRVFPCIRLLLPACCVQKPMSKNCAARTAMPHKTVAIFMAQPSMCATIVTRRWKIQTDLVADRCVTTRLNGSLARCSTMQENKTSVW